MSLLHKVQGRQEHGYSDPMLLRMILQQLVREKAEQTLRDAVDRQRGAPRADPQQPESDASDSTDESKPVRPLPPCDVGILFGTEAEASGMVDRLRGVITTRCVSFNEYRGELQDKRVVVAVSRLGPGKSEQAAKDFIHFHHPAWLISAGFAAALCKEIERGSMIMVDQIVRESGTEMSTGLTIDPDVAKATPNMHVGRLLTVERTLRTKSERRSLAEKFGAIAADQDSAAIAQVCECESTRFLSVQTITDDVDDEMPREVRNLIDQSSLAGKLGATAGALMRRPETVKEIWRLKQDALKASDRLAKFLTGVVDQLP